MDRPGFRKAKAAAAFASPEELFANLPNRSQSHGYLRQPQADVLRQYLSAATKPNIALELPTGTGKTAVGLLIAEWKRRQTGGRVAFLTVTNQLARQVLREAERLGIDHADLTGTRETRSAVEVGRYKTGQAIGITTYANLFNVNPVIQPSEVLVFDDAHGGEQAASDMWTVRIEATKSQSLYREALASIRPALTDGQFRAIDSDRSDAGVELADLARHPGTIEELSTVLSAATAAQNPSAYFPFKVIGHRLDACLVLVSSREIVIRPLVPPTHTHSPFFESRQRIYMSATLGGEADLQRGYGISDLITVRAQFPQWGKRYVFLPELYLDKREAWKNVSNVWATANPQRATILSPSASQLEKAYESFSGIRQPAPRRFEMRDVEESLTPFTESSSSVLTLAGRYDGIDLPGDDCRLLVIADAPSAVGALERHLRDHWRLGPILRRRERTRLIQGMGRCTRDATDYAVIFLMGQTLVDSVTTQSMLSLFPGEIQREIAWGTEQGKATGDDLAAISKMARGLLEDNNYRREANESLSEQEIPASFEDPFALDAFGKWEVEFSAALWSQDFTRAHEIARGASDAVSGAELSGYRAWWLYLASIASDQGGNREGAIDALRHARATGINSGYLDTVIRSMDSGYVSTADGMLDAESEAVWRNIDRLGWRGPAFGTALDEMLAFIAKPDDATTYHRGIEGFGKFVGATTYRPTDDGAPDVIWAFDGLCITFEAKAAQSLSKKYVLQALAHPDWARHHLHELRGLTFRPVAISPRRSVDEVARPFATELYHVTDAGLAEFANTVATSLRILRTSYVGKEFGAARTTFKNSLRRMGCDRDAILAMCSTRITD